MHFEYDEIPIGIPFDPSIAKHPRRQDLKYETFVQRKLESEGWLVLNNNYSVFFRAKNASTQWEINEPIVHSLFDDWRLRGLRRFCGCLYDEKEDRLPNPGHPDLLVYREDRSEVKFVEVKGSKSDRLTDGEKLGCSLIKVFLETRVEIVRVEGNPRRYSWDWPTDLSVAKAPAQ